MASSYENQLKLQQLIDNNTTPGQSTIDILSSLKLISYFEDSKNASTAAGTVAQEEIKWLKAGMSALKDNPALTNRFGSGFEGAVAISNLLKQKSSECVYDSILEGVLESKASGDLGLDLASALKRANNGFLGGAAITASASASNP